MATRKEVAELAGVSEATVSRVFNGVGPLKEATRRKVLEAAQRLGYHPNAIAQSFALGRSGNVGVVLPHVPKVHLFSAYYFAEILSGIGEALRENGRDMLVLLRSPDEEPGYAQLFRTRKIDACIVLGARDVPQQLAALRELRQEGMPFCLVNQRYDGERFSVVDADHVQGSYEATKHLVELGYRRIAFMNGSPEYSNSRDRLLGYRRALAEAGLEPPPGGLLEGNYSRTSGLAAAVRVGELRSSGLEAVVCANDRMAIGLVQGLRERGVAAGQDIAVVGYDDSDAARLCDPPLTSVSVPFYEMGRTAALRLLAAAQQSGAQAAEPFAATLPTKLVVRSSAVRRGGM
ncbi:LacI family transcriptional regulator [Gordoniibacillus kamchatkensis]|uniref:LacI family transcriptional regulator n=1 Tax=Gordoniibacillus kamchatkensis TaxID=1590651 RepID=A0ABR5AND2_9BACL|nr:LacI family DNA-binding transcriptional regulator [Paenibacillus sp. VKM B-2647]KIL42519.1 LacI family transcriptional regulator [Paenibacillus sp. VKM B-2647]